MSGDFYVKIFFIISVGRLSKAQFVPDSVLLFKNIKNVNAHLMKQCNAMQSNLPDSTNYFEYFHASTVSVRAAYQELCFDTNFKSSNDGNSFYFTNFITR